MKQHARDHGGDLDRAMTHYGTGRWLDLSTGINARSYPVADISRDAWTHLPTRTDIAVLEDVAATTYGTKAPVVALAGAQAAIQLVPRLGASGTACIVEPTYNEHAAALAAQGWQVKGVTGPEEAAGADLLTLVNPNNPDGRAWTPDEILSLADSVGTLVVDESFMDGTPGASVAPALTPETENILVLRSFGKFFGLAGLRLGFVVTGTQRAARLRDLAGPWPVNGPALAVGQQALSDRPWQETTRTQLAKDAQRLDALALAIGWRLVGGTRLFRTYATDHAETTRDRLARQHIWTRIFPYSDSWIRLGLPGSEPDWAQLERALSAP